MKYKFEIETINGQIDGLYGLFMNDMLVMKNHDPELLQLYQIRIESALENLAELYNSERPDVDSIPNPADNLVIYDHALEGYFLQLGNVSLMRSKDWDAVGLLELRLTRAFEHVINPPKETPKETLPEPIKDTTVKVPG